MRLRPGPINWRHALGELVLIVVGILVALGIDSYAERISERRQAQVYLAELAAELTADTARFGRRAVDARQMAEAATRALRVLETAGPGEEDLGARLLESLLWEGVAWESVVWAELGGTGRLNLIPDAHVRSAIVAHYLEREARFATIELNLGPAVRDLRALAWDVMPVEAFPRFFTSGSPGVPNEAILGSLRRRGDAAFLLKRLIITSGVAGRNLEEMVAGATGLLDLVGSGRPVG